MNRQFIFLREDVRQIAEQCVAMGNKAKAFRKKKNNSLSAGGSTLINAHLSTQYSETRKTEIKKKSYSEQKRDGSLPSETREWVKNKKRLTGGLKKRSHVTDSTNIDFNRIVQQKHNSISVQTLGVSEEQLQKGDSKAKQHSYRSVKMQLKQTSQLKQFIQSQKKQIAVPKELNDLSLLYWINEVLLQCTHQRTQFSAQLGAVKRYRIDPASLSSENLTKANISRIYKCLYVYSEGLGNLLREVSGKSRSVNASLWKVYSMLLQYCSGQHLDTIVSNLSKQNEQLESDYQQKLLEKQKLIEHCDFMSRAKTEKILREMNQLRHEKEHLLVEKDVMKNDVLQGQKALAEQISLRMLFQQKINSIHYVYRDISEKHALLYKDFKLKVAENTNLIEQKKKLEEENVQIKKQKWGLVDVNNSLRAQIRSLHSQFSRLEQKSFKQAQSESQWKSYKALMGKQLSSSKHHIMRLMKELQNAESNFTLIRQSFRALQGEYGRTLEENKRMITALQEQNEKNNKIFQERKTLSLQQITFENEKGYFLMKIGEKEDINKELKKEIQQLKDKLIQIEGESQLLKDDLLNAKQQLSSAHKTIESYKKARTDTETAAIDDSSTVQGLKKLLLQREKDIPSLKKELLQLRQTILQKDLRIEESVSKISVLREQISLMDRLREQSEQRYEALLKDGKLVQQKLQKSLVQKSIQMERYKELYDSISVQLSNQKFQRKTLEVSYRHSLSVLDNHSMIIKGLKTEVNETKERWEQFKRETMLKEMKMDKIMKSTQAEQEKIRERNAVLQEINSSKKQHVHPMIFEDARAAFIRKVEEHEDLKEYLSDFRQKYEEETNGLRSALRARQQDLREAQNKEKQMLGRHGYELEYQSKKHSQLFKKIEELEGDIVEWRAKVRAPAVELRDREKRYLQVIKQKGERLQQLAKEAEQMQQRCRDLVEQTRKRQREIDQQKLRILEIEDEKIALESKLSVYMDINRQLGKEKESLVQIIKNAGISGSEEEIWQSLRKTHSRVEDSQLLQEQDIRMTKWSKFSKERGEQNQSEAKRVHPQSVPKNKVVTWRVDFSTKMKQASNYYRR